jgi:hypothetical protein
MARDLCGQSEVAEWLDIMPTEGRYIFLMQALQLFSAINGLNLNPCRGRPPSVHVNAADTAAVSESS